ncbi:2861_t:CDS:1, partial [Racocetra fulgida]
NQPEPKQCSKLFAKLERGKATYSTYAPRKRIHTKNDFALIFETHNLENISTAELVETLAIKMR